METDRYLELFLEESREALRELNGHLLQLESAGSEEAVAEAFRAAHTVKGMAATMGLSGIAAVAHALEDRLDEVRNGRELDAFLLDDLFTGVDELERAIGAINAEDTGPVAESVAVVVTLRADAPLKAARAQLVVRNVAAVVDVERYEPAELDEDFDGELVLWVRGAPDLAVLEGAAERAGEVESVLVRRGGEAEAPAREAADPGADYVRVEGALVEELVDGVTELAVLHARSEDLYVLGRHEERQETADRMRRLLARLQDAAMRTRLVPVSAMFDRFPRLVRDLSRDLGREVDFHVIGRHIEIDRRILNEISEPVVHLLRNALDHGIRPPGEREAAGKARRGRLTMRARYERAQVLISVEDDGGGIDREAVLSRAESAGLLPPDVDPAEVTERELLGFLTETGLSTASGVTAVSGRGVGLDVVRERVRALGGSVSLRTGPDGTAFVLRLPISRAMMPAVRVRVGRERYIVPMTYVAEALELDGTPMGDTVDYGGERVRAIRLGQVLAAGEAAGGRSAVIVEVGENRAALVVDELLGRDQVVIRDFHRPMGALPLFSGVTVLDDGQPALVVDPVAIV